MNLCYESCCARHPKCSKNIIIQKGKNDFYIFFFFFSPCLPIEECLFQRVCALLRHHRSLLPGNCCFCHSALLLVLAGVGVSLAGVSLAGCLTICYT